MLLSYNYICHLSAFKCSIVEKINGFRVGVEGSQDHDLLLRVIAESKRNQIAHIPIPLYHWRTHSGSTSSNNSSKDYTSEAGLKAVNDFLSGYIVNNKYLGIPTAELIRPNRYRINWSLGSGNEPSVDLIIPTKDKASILRTAVESIFDKTNYSNYKITVVDNGSIEPETFDLYSRLQKKYTSKLRILRYDKPFNYSEINNFAVSQSESEIIGLVNNDVEVINAGWLTEMVSLAIQMMLDV